jgi:hypothetical protein
MTGVVLIALTILLLGSGCIFAGHDVDARVSCDGKKIAIIPFREQDLYFLESPAGAEVAGLVAQIIMKEALDVKLVNPSPAFKDFLQDKNPDAIEWGKMAEKLKVDFLLAGHIKVFRSRDPKKDINCYRGVIKVDVVVYCPDNTMKLVDSVIARYPSGRFSAPVMSLFEVEEEEVLNRLKAKAALEIARFFFPYSPGDY